MVGEVQVITDQCSKAFQVTCICMLQLCRSHTDSEDRTNSPSSWLWARRKQSQARLCFSNALGLKNIAQQPALKSSEQQSAHQTEQAANRQHGCGCRHV